MRLPTRPVPARCTACGSTWPVRTARFCGRCGVPLAGPTRAARSRDRAGTGRPGRTRERAVIGLAALAGTLLLAIASPSVPHPLAGDGGTAVELPVESDERPSPPARPGSDVPKRWCRTADGVRFDCVRWRVTSTRPGPRGPVVVDGRLVTVTGGGEVVALDLVAGTPVWTWHGSLGGEVVLQPRGGVVAREDGHGVAEPATASGVAHWAREPGTGPRASRQSGAEVIVLDDGVVLLLGARNGDVRGRYPLADGERLEAILPGGVLVASPTRMALLAGSGLTRRWEVAVEDATVVAHAGRERLVLLGADGRLEARDTASGEPLWRSDALVGTAGRHVRATRDRVLVTVGSPDPALIVLDARDGSRLWRHALHHASAIRAPATEAAGLVLVVEPRPFPALVALDPATGERRWTAGTDDTVRTDGLAAAGDLVVAPTGDQVLALEAATGTLVWRLDAAGARVVHSDPVVLTGEDGLLTLTVDATAVATAMPPPHTTGEAYLP